MSTPAGSPSEVAAAGGGLTSTLQRGARISAVSLIATQTISFVGTLAVARLLTPADVGTFAAATVLVLFLLVFTESGLCSALIQREHGVDDVADVVFWVTLATGTVTALVALLAAPVLGAVFSSTTVAGVAAVMSGSLLLYSLYVVPDYLMQRRFDFRRRMIVDPGVALTNAVVATTCAARGLGVWSLVVGTYASLVFWVVASWSLARWRPRGPGGVRRQFRELFGFALPVLANGLGTRVRDLVETVIVGRALDTTSLGYFRYGNRLALLPGLAVVQVVSYVLFPAFARLAGDADRFRRAFLRALGALWFVAAPVAALIVALGEPLVVLLLGERWRGAGVAFVAMAGLGLGEALRAISQQALMGSGRSRPLFVITLVNVVTGIGLVLALLPFGLLGVGLAISAAQLLMGTTALVLSCRAIGVPLRSALGRLAAPTVGAVVALAAVWPVERLLVRADTHGTWAGLGWVTVEVVAFLAVYLLATGVIARAAVVDVVELLGATLRGAGRTQPSTTPGES